MKAVSYYGFGGAYAVALGKTGIELSAVLEPGGFGLPVVLANKERLGFFGPSHRSHKSQMHDVDFPVYDGDILLGNPPCSGFSGLNTAPKNGGYNYRGVHSPINQCMWDLVSYAAKMNGGRGPKICVFESVQQAGKQGRTLMQELVKHLREQTGEPYVLYHVFMSGATVGAAQMRRRYFFVASKIPFGLTSPIVERVCTYEDAIGDLVGLKLQRDPQPYVEEPTWWVEKNGLRSDDGTVGDMIHPDNNWAKRMTELIPYWEQGWTQREALDNAMNNHGVMPSRWEHRDHYKELFGRHFSGARRIVPHQSGRVITGSGATPLVHYSEPRLLTIREGARLMGFPDWFRWDAVSPQRAGAYLGKQVPVQSWQWMLGHIKNAIEGQPGAWLGTAIDPYPNDIPEVLFDVTNDFKRAYDQVKYRHGQDFRNKKHLEEMERRTA